MSEIFNTLLINGVPYVPQDTPYHPCSVCDLRESFEESDCSSICSLYHMSGKTWKRIYGEFKVLIIPL